MDARPFRVHSSNELYPKGFHVNPPGFVGQVNEGRLAIVVYEMPDV